MKGMDLLVGMFAMVINKLTSTEEEVSSVPSHRWEVYPGNYREFQKQVVSNFNYCRKLQKEEKEKEKPSVKYVNYYKSKLQTKH